MNGEIATFIAGVLIRIGGSYRRQMHARNICWHKEVADAISNQK